MIKYEDFKQYNFNHLLAINEDIDIKEHTLNKIKYIVIDNFFKNPYDLINYLKQFPVENYDEHILSTYSFGDKVESEIPFLKPPGMQQLLPHKYFEFLGFNLYKILIEKNFILDKGNSIHNNPEKMKSELHKFVYYTNIFYPGMFCLNKNNAPHFDQFEYASNTYLSEEIGGGTAFYSLKYKDKKYYSVSELYSEEFEVRKEISELMDNYMKADNIIKPLTPVNEDDVFKLEGIVEYKFNRFILYKGDSWHSVYYDSENELNTRYSLSACFSGQKDELR